MTWYFCVNLILRRVVVIGVIIAWATISCSRGGAEVSQARLASAASAPQPAAAKLDVVATDTGDQRISIGLRPQGAVPATAKAVVEIVDANGKAVSTKTGKLDDFGFQ